MGTVRELITKIVWQADTSEIDKAQQSTEKFRKGVQTAGKDADAGAKKASASFGKLSSSVSKASESVNSLRNKVRGLSNQTATIHVRTDSREAEASLTALKNKASGGVFASDFLAGAGVGGALSPGMVAGAGALATGGALYGAVKIFAEFDATMSRVKALTQANDEEMKALTKTARELGASTKYSANEAAQAMTYLGMAGWETNNIIKAMPGLLDLAAASGEDLARVADIVSDDLTAFKMSADQSTHFADVLTVASTKANTTVSMMGETFKYVGPLAGSMGYTIEDMALATGLMANQSIKGEQAGTSLRGLLTRLIKPTKESAEAMDRLGLSITDDTGKMKTFRQILIDMRAGFAKLSEAEKGEVAAMLAGQEAMSGTLAMANESQEVFDKYINELDNADGAAKRAADTMNDNLVGSLKELQSQAEETAMVFGKKFEPPIRNAVKNIKDALHDATEAMKEDGEGSDPTSVGADYRAFEFTPLQNLEGLLERIRTLWGGFIDGLTIAFPFAAHMVGDGLSDMQKAWNNVMDALDPFMPFLEWLTKAIGTTLLSVASATFRIIAAYIERATSVLKVMGKVVEEVAQALSWLIDNTIAALKWLGLVNDRSQNISNSGWERAMQSMGVTQPSISYGDRVQTNTFNVGNAMDMFKIQQNNNSFFAYNGG